MLSRKKIFKLAESTSNNPDVAEWTIEFARLVEAETLRKVARAENGAGNVVISTRDLFLLAKQAARAAKEGK